ncbi:ExbD/TolR family protein [Paucihalobacter sp.]|uniref:ExbD/TolR family protein n=1 Tax=Paucihalobacter sp. TaxID=2850405 RepID=UPI002FDFE469
MAKRSAPEVNAGSMADIAFLLLIFFLVTTTIEKDKGILRSLPPIEPPNDDEVIIKQKNLFVVLIGRNDDLLVEDERMKLKDLRKAAIEFLDNGGDVDNDGNPCDYCQGKKDPTSSDHPDKAIISLQHDRETSYGKYIEVQNELVAAYNFLRNREAKRLYGSQYPGVEDVYFAMLAEKEKNQFKRNEELEERIAKVKIMFPMKLSEAEPKS